MQVRFNTCCSPFQKAANVYDHTIQVHAKNYTPKNEDDVPSGKKCFDCGDLVFTKYSSQVKKKRGKGLLLVIKSLCWHFCRLGSSSFHRLEQLHLS